MVTKINLDGQNVELNWATEETQAEILKALTKKTTNTNNSAQTKIKANNNATKSMSKLGKSVDTASSKFSKMGKSAADIAEDLSKTKATVSGLNDRIFSLLGSVGGLGTAAGFVAQSIDSFIEAQVSAIQSGFEFSDQLINTRSELANMGLNFSKFTNIIANNGEAIRSLGDTGTAAASAFSNLVQQARNGAESMGYFGLSSEEIALEMADTLDSLRKSGVSDISLASEASKSFNILNREVLGYAKISGRERREIMRNRTLVEDDSAFLSAMGTLGDAAITSAKGMTDAFSGTFGEAGGFLAGLMKSSINSQLNQFQTLSAEEAAALQSVPGLADVYSRYAEDFIKFADDPQKLAVIQTGYMNEIGTILGNEEEYIRNRFYRFQKTGNQFAGFYESLLGAVVESRVSIDNIQKTGRDSMNQGISDTTATLIKFNNEMDKFIKRLKAKALTEVGFDDVDSLKVFKWNEWGDTIEGLGTAAFIGGITAMFAAPALINGVSSAITGLFATRGVTGAVRGVAGGIAGSVAGGSAAGAATTGAASGASKLKKLLPFAKKLGWLGAAIGAGTGIMDQDYQDAGIGIGGRAASGIVQGGLETVDLIHNLIAAGIGSEERMNLGGKFHKGMITDPALIPDDFNPSSNRISSNNMIVSGAKFGNSGAITRNNISNAVPGADLNARALDLAEEANRLNKKILDAIESQ